MDSNGMHFFTMLYGILNVCTGKFRFVCAGHPEPIIVRAGGTVELELNRTGELVPGDDVNTSV